MNADYSIKPGQPFFVFDVESIGLYGEAFAVGGGVYIDGKAVPDTEFCYSCPTQRAEGSVEDRQWVRAQVPPIEVTHDCPYAVREAFWEYWRQVVQQYPHILAAGECIYPVEAYFLRACISQAPRKRKYEGPYPLHDIATFMLAAGMGPIVDYLREAGETPRHHPLCDARQSARLLAQALSLLRFRAIPGEGAPTNTLQVPVAAEPSGPKPSSWAPKPSSWADPGFRCPVCGSRVLCRCSWAALEKPPVGDR